MKSFLDRAFHLWSAQESLPPGFALSYAPRGDGRTQLALMKGDVVVGDCGGLVPEESQAVFLKERAWSLHRDMG